ncbi:MAG TPA: type II secretion system F family protein [Candidatus Binataceae bacterium]|nr:type II secretion system F family protein [Candidatus Binataceae bacterium]
MDVVFSVAVFALVFVTLTVALTLRREAATERESRASRLSSATEPRIDDSIIRKRALMLSASHWASGLWVVRTLEENLLQAGLYLGVVQFLLWSAIFAAGGLGAGMLVWKDPAYAALTAIGAGLLPWSYVRIRRRRRVEAFMKQLPLALDVIKSSLEAGHMLQRALQVLVGEFEAPLGTEFRIVLEQTRIGVPLAKALADLADRVPQNDFRLLVVAVKIQSEVGTSLAPIIGRLAELVRARDRLHQQVRSFSAQLRMGGFVVALLPIFVLTIFGFSEPGYTKMLFYDPAGVILLKVAIACDVSAFFIVRQLMKLKY